MDASGKRFAVVVSRWNELITKALLEGALDELGRHGAEAVEVVHVPGSWEIPAAAATLAELPAETRPNAIIALGCILQGATVHAQILAGDVANELMRLQTDRGVPIAWGVLTPVDMEQAKERAGLKFGNKGREAALAAIEMASVRDQLTGAD
jgi:6,7-dimethyl-8-ribityllumazine synthase